MLTGVRDVGERCEAEGLGAAAESGPFPRTEEHCPVSCPAPEATARRHSTKHRLQLQAAGFEQIVVLTTMRGC